MTGAKLRNSKSKKICKPQKNDLMERKETMLTQMGNGSMFPPNITPEYFHFLANNNLSLGVQTPWRESSNSTNHSGISYPPFPSTDYADGTNTGNDMSNLYNGPFPVNNSPAQAASLMPPQFAMADSMVKKEDNNEYRLSSIPSVDKSVSQSSSNSPNHLGVTDNRKKELTVSAEIDKLPDESLTEEQLKARKKAQNRAAQKAF
ncbi:AP-1-like transcription factor YAP3 [Nakaseomyces bracarensis]